jgi:4-hydroxy-4-methyl-2-oxoglutarate aldolase
MDTTVQERLAQYATPTLFEAATEVAALGTMIIPLSRPIRLCGPAFTVRAAPADNLPVHNALAEAPAGSVLAIATEGDAAHAFWGEIMTEAALARGVAGLVIDAAVRDTAAIRRSGFPIFSAGIAVAGPGKKWRGILQQPIELAGAVIRPGDWIVGDDDGVVVVPAQVTERVIELAQARVEKEARIIERLRGGELTVDLLGLREMVDSDEE